MGRQRRPIFGRGLDFRSHSQFEWFKTLWRLSPGHIGSGRNTMLDRDQLSLVTEWLQRWLEFKWVFVSLALLPRTLKQNLLEIVLLGSVANPSRGPEPVNVQPSANNIAMSGNAYPSLYRFASSKLAFGSVVFNLD